MPTKRDADATSGTKLLRLFQRLMLDGRRHYLKELAEWLNCSSQTIIRLTNEIEGVIGAKLQTGLEGHRRWYQICPQTRRTLGLDFEELRYLRICRDLADPYLPDQVKKRLDESIFRFSMLLSELPSTGEVANKSSKFTFFSKGRIDYTAHFEHIDHLIQALETHCVCVITYKAAGKSSPHPYRFALSRIASMNNALYALGAELNDDDSPIRTLSLAVHRMQDVQVTKTPIHATIPDVSPGMFGLPWHPPKTFRIKFSPGKVSDYVRERIWADSQVIEECEDGGVLLTLTTCSEPELRSWVFSFGGDAVFVHDAEDKTQENAPLDKQENGQ